nr:immunoglobulin light chain junction region [Macaca mulatta]
DYYCQSYDSSSIAYIF